MNTRFIYIRTRGSFWLKI